MGYRRRSIQLMIIYVASINRLVICFEMIILLYFRKQNFQFLHSKFKVIYMCILEVQDTAYVSDKVTGTYLTVEHSW